MKKLILFLSILFLISCESEKIIQAEQVEIIDYPSEILIGESDFIEYKVLPSDASSKSVVFASSDKNIIEVSQNGKLTAHKKGEVTIKVSTKDGQSVDECEIEAVEIDALIDFGRNLIGYYDPENKNLMVGARVANWSEKDIQLKSFVVTSKNDKVIREDTLSDILKPDEKKEFIDNYYFDDLPIKLTITYIFNGKEFSNSFTQDEYMD